MKQIIQASLLSAECLVLALVLTSCGEPTSQIPSTAPEPGPTAAPASEGAVEGATTGETEPAAETAPTAQASPHPARSAPAAGDAVRSSAAGLTVRRLVVARDVESREPVGAGSRFIRNGEPLFAFIEMASEAEGPRQVLVTFEHDDGERVGHVTLEIPASASRWRTWALSRNIGRAGHWRAVVRTDEGELLGEVPFEVI